MCCTKDKPCWVHRFCRWFTIVRCSCGAEIINGAYCTNGHVQNR